jgi:DNA-binding PadR family transcriptional regulator
MDNAMTLLGLLETGCGYGYDLKQRYDRLFGLRRQLAFGQIYATLARLVRDKLIVEVAEAEPGHRGDRPPCVPQQVGRGPEPRRYRITEDGRARISRWLFTPDTPHEALQSNVFAKTVIALLIEDDAERLLDLQRAAHLEQMRGLTRQKQDADLIATMLCDHALFHLEADLRWMDLLEARLGELRGRVKDVRA